MRFWIGFVVMAVTVVVGLVWTLRWYGDETQRLKERLNARYVEEIDIQYTSTGRSSSDLIVIDGETRYDCSEEDAVLTCSDDPQPTRE